MPDFNNKKELGVKGVLYAIFVGLMSILFFFSAVTVWNLKIYLLAVFFVVLTLLSFVPHRILKVTQGLKWLLLIILFFVGSGISGKIAPVSSLSNKKIENYTIGEKYTVSNVDKKFTMVVNETSIKTSMTSSGQEVTTPGYYLGVTGETENIGTSATEFKLRANPELTDDKGRTYTLYATNVAGGMLQPNVPSRFSYFFEIPKDATGLTFIVRDSTQIVKSVSLGQ